MPAPMIDAFVEIYSAEVVETYQNHGYLLPSFCKPAAVQGSRLYWHKLEKLETGDVTKDDFAPHVFTGQDHSMISIDCVDREVPSAMKKLDLLKTNVDFRAGYVKNQLALLGRFADAQVRAAFELDRNAEILGPGFDVGLSISHIHQLRETFDSNYIPNDGQRFVLVTPRVWSQLLSIEEFVNADYCGPEDLPYKGPGLSAKTFQTFNFVQYNDATRFPMRADGTPWISGTHAANLRVGNVARCMAWHKEAIGHGTNAAPDTTITYENTMSAWAIVTTQSMNAKVIDDTGVFAWDVDELQPVAA